MLLELDDEQTVELFMFVKANESQLPRALIPLLRQIEQTIYDGRTIEEVESLLDRAAPGGSAGSADPTSNQGET